MAGGKLARFVGGCVRDTLIDREFSDIDIATEESPESVLQLLKAAKITVKPLGIEHGSVLAILNKHSYNITTLRTDIETDGRYAQVSYTDNWQADANRRDFTMNALYADLNGTYYDPCQGYQDLKGGVIRFIGDADQRISEDYLRILRYFRFLAHYGKTPPQQANLHACQTHATRLKSISKERIWAELHRLLEAEDVSNVLQYMQVYGILNQIFSNEVNLSGLAKLIDAEKKYQIKPNALRRLTAISCKDISHLSSDLKLATKDLNYISRLQELVLSKPDLTDKFTCNSILYNDGPYLFLDLSLLLTSDLKKNIILSQNWHSPKLPISGQDLVNIGLSKGPELGKNLKALTQWWIEQSFKPSAADCLDWVRRNKL